MTPPQDATQDAIVAQAVAVPLAERQALAGYYQQDDNRVAIVAVSDGGLEMKTNIEPLWRLRPESADRYFLPATGLRVRFDRAGGTLTVSQSGIDNGPARRVDAAAVECADAYVATWKASLLQVSTAGAGTATRYGTPRAP